MLLSIDEGKLLVKIARDVIESHVKGGKYELPEIPDSFKKKRGIFCTLTIKGELRGCIGVPYPEMQLIDALVDSAKSACHDPRFPVLRDDELKKIKIEISVLTEPEAVESNSTEELLKKIKPREDGIIIKYGFSSALFLPQVWEQLPEKEDFLSQLCMKAGLYPDTWKDQKAKVFRFHVQIFKE